MQVYFLKKKLSTLIVLFHLFFTILFRLHILFYLFTYLKVGVGMSMEGIEQNPVVYDLMSEMSFRHNKVDVKVILSFFSNSQNVAYFVILWFRFIIEKLNHKQLISYQRKAFPIGQNFVSMSLERLWISSYGFTRGVLCNLCLLPGLPWAAPSDVYHI